MVYVVLSILSESNVGSAVCTYCIYVCAECRVCLCVQEMILQGAVLSHTCSVSSIVLSLFNHLICRDATKHTHPIWFQQGKASLIGALDGTISMAIRWDKCCCLVSWGELSQSSTTCSSRLMTIQRANAKNILVHAFASANDACFVMILINSCHFQNHTVCSIELFY